ncbi:MAG: DUF6879 family protein [Streptosporangiaceae bacterium]
MATEIRDALTSAQRSAMHLEMRDHYTPDDPAFADWRVGKALDPAQRWRSWFDLVSATVARGVSVRRVRIVSEPVTDYIRFEHTVTGGLNVAAGEQVRWLPRRRAADLLVPGCDLWVFDDSVVIFNHFAGDGSRPSDATERREDAVLAQRVAGALDTIWKRAIPHEKYKPV